VAKLPNQDRLDNIAAVARPEEAAVQAKIEKIGRLLGL
jgi:hypothetical protein